jgi:methylated-DNA-[protein]-cysteine S-methyltransferase
MQDANAIARVATPLGAVWVCARGDVLTAVRIGGIAPEPTLPTPLLAEAVRQIQAFFAGTLTQFDLPLHPLESEEGRTLRAGIASIPYGETLTYGALAARTGSVARAVGQACKTNAFPLIIPCHRVISTSGREYYSAGDGPRTKSWLLDFEYDHLPPDQRTRLI